MGYRSDRAVTLLSQTTIGAAAANVVAGTTLDLIGMRCCTVQSTFVYGAGGTTLKVWIQTSFDHGTTWLDIMNFAYTTASATKISSVRNLTAVAPALAPTSGVLGDDLILDGVLGGGLRALYTSTGTYSGLTHLTVHAIVTGE